MSAPAIHIEERPAQKLPEPKRSPHAGASLPVSRLTERLTDAFRPAESLDETSERQLAETLRQSLKGTDEASSEYAACLLPLLRALEWRGETRELAEALPHFETRFDLTSLRNVLANLGYPTRPMRLSLSECDARLTPFLYEPQSGGMFVVLDLLDNGVARVFDGAEERETAIDARETKGAAFFVEGASEDAFEKPRPKEGWMRGVLRRFEKQAWQLLGVTFFTNCLAMAAPLFIMAVYNQVIANQSLPALFYLGAGITLALLFDFGLKLVKARMIAYIGARIDDIVGSSTLDRILHMPPVATESAPVGAQVARIKQFESVREFFTGPFASVALEIPFVFLFIAVIAALGGPLALIPVVMIGLFAAAALIIHPRMKRAVAVASAAKARRNGFLVETLSSLRAIKQASAEAVWAERHRALSAETAILGFYAAQLNFAMQTVCNIIMMSAGVATMSFGVYRVLDGAMSVGALIAVMALVWRVLSPLQSAFMMLTKLEGIKQGVEQINQLMRYEPESGGANRSRTLRQFAGRVTFLRASLKYLPDRQPALLGLSCDIRAGETVAVVGGNGSGKSTVIKLIAGMYRPQAGLVAIDGVDIRQLDPVSLRQTIAYVPQDCKLFHGTIAQNIRLSHPVATLAEVKDACELAGVWGDIEALPEGLETRIGDQIIHRLPQGFRQRLALARAFVKRAPVLLLDEAANGLDDAGDQSFVECLRKLKGAATIIMVTHRPSHIRLADRVIHLEGGAAAMIGAPDDYLTKLFGGNNGGAGRKSA